MQKIKKININPTFIKHFKKYNKKFTQPLKLYSYNLKIISDYIGYSFLVYNGKNFKTLIIKENMVGYNLSSFILSKKIPRYIKKQKK